MGSEHIVERGASGFGVDWPLQGQRDHRQRPLVVVGHRLVLARGVDQNGIAGARSRSDVLDDSAIVITVRPWIGVESME